jgi:hypothetical protein
MTMDRDFVLVISQSSPYGSRALVERHSDGVLPSSSSSSDDSKATIPKAGFAGPSLALQVTFCEAVSHIIIYDYMRY